MWARATLLFALAACALGACGGGDSDEEQVRSALTDALNKQDPELCTERMTQRFVEQVSRKRGEAAVRDCRADVKDEPLAKDASLKNVSQSGSTAQADVEIDVSELPLDSLNVGLRKVDGDWKLDRLKGGKLDRPEFFRFARKQLTEPPNALDAETTTCALREFKDIDDASIARAFVNSDKRLFVFAGALCGLRVQGHMTGRTAACARGPMRREFTTGAIGRRLAADPEDTNGAIRAGRNEIRRIIIRCGGREVLRRI